MSFVVPRKSEGHLRTRLLNTAAALVSLWTFFAAPGVITLAGQNATESHAQMPDMPDGGIQVRIEATPKSATVGDPIRMDLEVTAPAGYRVEFPAVDKQVGDFSILEFTPVIPAIRSKKAQPLEHARARIVAAVYRTGAFNFPALEIRLRTPEGKQITVSSTPVKIEIQSVLSQKDQTLRDLKKQEEIPEPFRWVLWLSVLAALAAAVIIVWILWRRKRGRQPLAPAVPPQDFIDLAAHELRQLLARGLPEGGKVKPFYILLSDIVKRLLEAGFAIHTAEKTTSEIMDSLRRSPGADAENTERIESFLIRCDIVKFAKYIPSKDEHAAAAEDALWLLGCSRKAVERRQAAVGIGVENT